MPPANQRWDLHRGDCRRVLPALPPASVELCLSDIPYGIDLDAWDVLHRNTNSALGGRSPAQARLGPAFKRRGKPINGWAKADLARPREYEAWCRQWGGEVLRVLKPGASLLVFCGRRTMHRAMVAFEDAGFLVRDLLCWQKGAAHHRAQSLAKLFSRRGMDAAARDWVGWRLGNPAPAFEPIAWLFKPYKIGGTIADNVLEHGVGAMNAAAGAVEGKNPTNVLRFDFAPAERGAHAAQKPIALLRYLIELTTRQGATVLDPFAGSGSTGVAALELGRRFVGIERDARHAAAARRRLRAAAMAARRPQSRTL